MAKLKKDLSDAERWRRSEKVWAMRLAGLTYRQIGTKLNISEDTVKRDIDRIKIDYPTQNVRELIAEQNAKLVEMMKPQFFKAINGDRRAVEVMLKMMDQQAKLFGLYDHEDDNGQADVMAAFRAMGEAIRGKAA